MNMKFYLAAREVVLHGVFKGQPDVIRHVVQRVVFICGQVERTNDGSQREHTRSHHDARYFDDDMVRHAHAEV